MIEINLLPGAAKRNRGRGSGFSLRAVAAQVSSRIRDPYMLSAAASVLIAALGIGGMHFTQSSKVAVIEGRQIQALRDSTRFTRRLLRWITKEGSF